MHIWLTREPMVAFSKQVVPLDPASSSHDDASCLLALTPLFVRMYDGIKGIE